MTKHQSVIQSLPSKQPCLNTVYGLSRFTGFYFIAGLNARVSRDNSPYWEVILQDAFDTLTVYSDAIAPIISQLSPYGPVQVECARRQQQGSYYFKADMINPISEIPAEIRHVGLIPYSAVINGHDLPQLINTVSAVGFAPLQKFINRVLLQSKVMVPFVRNPASLKHHHNKLGGLLTHSLAVADLIAKEFTQGTMDHDIALTAALLHDIGKTQTLSDKLGRTAIGSLADHGALTLELCAEPLSLLSTEHLYVANQLRHAWTCASPNARYGFKPRTRVARYLQIADNFIASHSQHSI